MQALSSVRDRGGSAAASGATSGHSIPGVIPRSTWPTGSLQIAIGVIFWYEFGGGREYFERRATW